MYIPPGTVLERSAAEGGAAAAAADLRTLLAAAGPALLASSTPALLAAAPTLLPGHALALRLLMAVADAGALLRVAAAASLNRLSCCFAPSAKAGFGAGLLATRGLEAVAQREDCSTPAPRDKRGERADGANSGRGAKRRRAESWADSEEEEEEEDRGHGAGGKARAARHGATPRKRQTRAGARARPARRKVSQE